MDNDTYTFVGKANDIIFSNQQNGYKIFWFTIQDEDKRIKVTGICPSLQLDVLYSITGQYKEHPRYGIQFELSAYARVMPKGKEAVIRYFSGINFKGIGKKTAEKIVDTFGEDAAKILREDFSKINETTLSDKQKQIILKGLQETDPAIEELIQFVNQYGISRRNIMRLHQAYGNRAVKVLKENPYQVVRECDGFGFQTADKIGGYLDIPYDDKRRLTVLLEEVLKQICFKTGDTFATYPQLQRAFCVATQIDDIDFDDILKTDLSLHTIVQEEERYYPCVQYESESFIASFLQTFPQIDTPLIDKETINDSIDTLEEEIAIRYDDKQKEAIQAFFASPVSIITGGPGTGKTTVVKALTSLYKKLYPTYTITVCAPTGRAAKRLSEVTETNGMTIHSLLKWDLESNTFAMNENEPIHSDLLIIDEFSMVDNFLFASLLKASANVRKICIIGDEDQLPSVGPGCCLRDLIAANCFSLCRLQTIHRQQEGSDVITLASQIRKGDIDFTGMHSDSLFIETQDIQLKQEVIKIVQAALDQNYDLSDIQVLSPMYKGNCGIDVLNNALQACFNPPATNKREMKLGFTTFRVNDKILQLKNQPDDDVYNGDIGILKEIIEAKESEDHEKKVVVDFGGNYVSYNTEEMSNITLAYCISVHKSQGSEYPIVIMPFSHQHRIMLKRNLIYTGCTRARKTLYLLGDLQAFRQGVKTVDTPPRQTTLRQRLQDVATALEDAPF